MITFNVVKETHGWAIRTGAGMMTPFWSRESAVREANCLARAVGCHGEQTEVVIDEPVPVEPAVRMTVLAAVHRSPDEG